MVGQLRRGALDPECRPEIDRQLQGGPARLRKWLSRDNRATWISIFMNSSKLTVMSVREIVAYCDKDNIECTELGAIF